MHSYIWFDAKNLVKFIIYTKGSNKDKYGREKYSNQASILSKFCTEWKTFLTLCPPPLGFFFCLPIFFIIQDTIRVSNRLVPDQAPCFAGPHLGQSVCKGYQYEDIREVKKS